MENDFVMIFYQTFIIGKKNIAENQIEIGGGRT